MNFGENKRKLKILEIDPLLEPFEEDLNNRMLRYQTLKNQVLETKKTFYDFANGHHYFGFHKVKGGWYYREWAPNAESLSLIGDFNYWNYNAHPLEKKENGCWEIFIPDIDNLKHTSRVKVRVVANGCANDRIPLYIKRAVQDEFTKDFTGQVWEPEKEFNWTDNDFNTNKIKPLLIYETHVGMAQEEKGIGTFSQFTELILPRVKKNGYNTIQLMAIMEHPYYGSFGYQVSNFFAVSSRFGTPDDLKILINTAHSMGIVVLLDLVHSHSVKNLSEGINEFDGTDYQFFHTGNSGNHPAWDSKLFNYNKHEVIHFLLSNIKYWMEEYHFDGFRFDGVTSMIYHHRGLGESFTDYKKYFDVNTDVDAVTYLQFANELIKEVRPDAITIAEDMSGMPGMCLPIKYGGIGFDYRLSMGVPDFWIKTLKEKKDEDWDLRHMWYELTTRRAQEKNIGYCESHDQALVGDKTIIFWLADKEMYWHMRVDDDNLIIDRAISLHKLIRFVTLTLAGEGYLNFMGNEFGHPEWVDFPREGNNWSYHYARRQWSLADREDLKYKYLYKFDKKMLKFIKSSNVFGANDLKNLWIDNNNKILVFQKKELVFVFNFHPNLSFENYGIPVDIPGKYKVIFNTDKAEFGGHVRIDEEVKYSSCDLPEKNNTKGVIIYLPNRTALVLKKIK